MNLIHYSPNRWFDSTFDRFIPDFRIAPAGEAENGRPESYLPRVDIRDEQEAILLTAEIPGVPKDGVKVEVKERVLTLSGEKKNESERGENGFYRSERSFGAFQRSFTLPEGIDADKISGTFEDGVLRLTLPKKPEAKPRQIELEAGNGKAREIEVG